MRLGRSARAPAAAQRAAAAPGGAADAAMASSWPDRLAGELIGDLDGPVAVVDRAGSVAPGGAGWRICWAVGAEDRWHVASEESAVRSRLVGDMPVTATAMRVPGGDVVQRAAAVRDAAGRAVVLEFANEAPVPVSLALAVVPDAAGARAADGGRVGRARVVGSMLVADGRAALELGRTPGGAAAVADGEVWQAVRAEPPAGDCEALSRSGLAAAVAVVPLASRVPLRVTVPIEGGPVQARSPDEATAGWRAVVAQAASVELPDENATRAWRRGIAASILAASDTAPSTTAARIALVLDCVGLADEADRGRAAVLAAAERSRLSAADASAALRALASRRLKTGRVSGLAELAGPLADAAGDHLDAFTLELVSAVLEIESPAASHDARRLLADVDARASPSALWPAAIDLAAAVVSSTAFGGDGPAGIEALLGCLVAEASDHLVIAPDLPTPWIGAPVDARGLVTRHGVLSYSLRWHGVRPAVLWDLQPAGNNSARDVAIRCGLDHSWSSTVPAGEALLGPGRAGPEARP